MDQSEESPVDMDFEVLSTVLKTTQSNKIVDINLGNSRETFIRALLCQFLGGWIPPLESKLVSEWSVKVGTIECPRRCDVAYDLANHLLGSTEIKEWRVKYSDPWQRGISLENAVQIRKPAISIPNLISLKSYHGTYLALFSDGRLCHGKHEDRSVIEKIDVEGAVALKVSKLWRYLSATSDGRLGLMSQLRNTEKFQLEVVGNQVALKSEHGTYLCAMKDGTFKLQRYRRTWELFTIIEEQPKICSKSRLTGAVFMFFFNFPSIPNGSMNWASNHLHGMDKPHPSLTCSSHSDSSVTAQPHNGYYHPENVEFWRKEFSDASYAGLDFLLLNTNWYSESLKEEKTLSRIGALKTALSSMSPESSIRLALLHDTDVYKIITFWNLLADRNVTAAMSFAEVEEACREYQRWSVLADNMKPRALTGFLRNCHKPGWPVRAPRLDGSTEVQLAAQLIATVWIEFFRTVPREFWCLVQGRPLVYFYNAGSLGKGASAPVFQQVKEQFKAEFGCAPFLVVDTYWRQDPGIAGVADQFFKWSTFTEEGNLFTNEMNGLTLCHAMTRWDSEGRDQLGKTPERTGVHLDSLANVGRYRGTVGGAPQRLQKGDEILRAVLKRSRQQEADLLVIGTWNDVGEGTNINRCYDYYEDGRWLAPTHYMDILREEVAAAASTVVPKATVSISTNTTPPDLDTVTAVHISTPDVQQDTIIDSATDTFTVTLTPSGDLEKAAVPAAHSADVASSSVESVVAVSESINSVIGDDSPSSSAVKAAPVLEAGSKSATEISTSAPSEAPTLATLSPTASDSTSSSPATALAPVQAPAPAPAPTPAPAPAPIRAPTPAPAPAPAPTPVPAPVPAAPAPTPAPTSAPVPAAPAPTLEAESTSLDEIVLQSQAAAPIAAAAVATAARTKGKRKSKAAKAAAAAAEDTGV